MNAHEKAEICFHAGFIDLKSIEYASEVEIHRDFIAPLEAHGTMDVYTADWQRVVDAIDDATKSLGRPRYDVTVQEAVPQLVVDRRRCRSRFRVLQRQRVFRDVELRVEGKTR